jgi:RIO kinase 1
MPNDPYLDASVAWRIKSGNLEFKESDYQSVKEGILSSGLATEVIGLISSGKEADVYLCTYRGAPIAVKAYRLYRTSHRGGRPIKLDSIGWLAAHEFEMTRQAWNGGVRVPAPARRVENMFSMRYLGSEDRPSPRLSDCEPDDPAAMLDEVLTGVEELARAGVVHSDLSAFNILVHEGRPWFIDLAEAIRVDRTGDVPWKRLQEASAALDRGLSALQGYFGRYGLRIEKDPLTHRIVKSLDKYDVLG